MQVQDRSVNLDINYPSTVMLENCLARTVLSVSDVGQVSTAGHLKRESGNAQWDSGHLVEQQSVTTVQQAMLVQTVDRYLSLVSWDNTQMSRTLSLVINARRGLNVRQPVVILWLAQQVRILS